MAHEADVIRHVFQAVANVAQRRHPGSDEDEWFIDAGRTHVRQSAAEALVARLARWAFGAAGGGRPLSPRTVGYVHAVLRKAFNDAVRTDQLLPSNPADWAKRPRATAVPGVREVWDAQQLATFLDLVAAHRLLPFFRLAAFTGARRGELLHLRWEDVWLDGS